MRNETELKKIRTKKIERNMREWRTVYKGDEVRRELTLEDSDLVTGQLRHPHGELVGRFPLHNHRQRHSPASLHLERG